MSRRFSLLGGLALALSWSISSAHAETPVSENTWNAVVRADDESKSCHATAKFDASTPRQRSIEIFVDYVPSLPGRGWSTTLRFPALADDREVVVTIADRRFEFASKDNTAWLRHTADEDRIVDALKSGETVTVRVSGATNEDGEYRLNAAGLKTALNAMAKDCVTR